ncbi:MAG: formate/nitrite transporter family protein [Erysipelotrichia bacterium]|nr:formate/nitrite transporter family protein [Erysipelotrichia bacterium]
MSGNCLTTIIPLYHKKAKMRDLFPAWILCYLGNMLGICLIGVLFIISQSDSDLFENYLNSACVAKLNFTFFPLLMRALLCNFIVCMASFAWHKVEKDGTKIIIMMFLVAAFVIAGLEHCVANWGFFAMTFTQYGFDFDWTQFPLHMVITTLGNIIGGSLLLGYPLYQIMKNDK